MRVMHLTNFPRVWLRGRRRRCVRAATNGRHVNTSTAANHLLLMRHTRTSRFSRHPYGRRHSNVSRMTRHLIAHGYTSLRWLTTRLYVYTITWHEESHAIPPTGRSR